MNENRSINVISLLMRESFPYASYKTWFFSGDTKKKFKKDKMKQITYLLIIKIVNYRITFFMYVFYIHYTYI